jgi:hypothetical protein
VLFRHGRACSGHPDVSKLCALLIEIAGPSAAMIAYWPHDERRAVRLVTRVDHQQRDFLLGAFMHWMLSAILAAAGLAAIDETGSASPLGLWLAKDGARVRISPCGRNLCGFIVQSSSPTDAATGRPPTDKNNADPAKRNRPWLASRF